MVLDGAQHADLIMILETLPASAMRWPLTRNRKKSLCSLVCRLLILVLLSVFLYSLTGPSQVQLLIAQSRFRLNNWVEA